MKRTDGSSGSAASPEGQQKPPTVKNHDSDEIGTEQKPQTSLLTPSITSTNGKQVAPV